MKVAILALVVFVVLIGSPPVSEAQSPNDGQLIAVIAVVDAEIKSAESENAQFSTGLVKALIESRIHTTSVCLRLPFAIADVLDSVV